MTRTIQRKLTKEEKIAEKTADFKKRASIIHNNFYDYSKVVVINMRSVVIIICPIHGEFLQLAYSHLQHKGCAKCYRREKSTLEEFKRKANIIHNNFYDYSKCVYINNHTLMIIICPIHGEFLQNANNHLNGVGCGQCAIEKRAKMFASSKEIFENRSNIIHNYMYGYDLVDYINCKSLVKIYCKKHNIIFEQSPYAHLKGGKCPICLKEDMKKRSLQKNLLLFKSKSNKVHNNFYDYSKVLYRGNLIPVEVICPIHGSFNITPTYHIQGGKCQKCSIKQMNNQEDFERISNVTHNNFYDYSKAIYEKSKDKVEIICPIHGSFWQTPEKHANGGQKCPKCKQSKGENVIDRYLNKYNIKYETQHKFEGCVYKRILKFDFYLPEYNTCIEFDGQQHSEPHRYSKDPQKNLKKFEQVKLRDSIKNQYCLDHSIRLIRISYTDIDRIDEILEKELK